MHENVSETHTDKVKANHDKKDEHDEEKDKKAKVTTNGQDSQGNQAQPTKSDDTQHPQASPCSPKREVKRPYTRKSEQSKTEPETNTHHPQSVYLKPRAKSAGRPYATRLTPEDQELVYERKANMMRRIQQQNAALESEVSHQRSMQSLPPQRTSQHGQQQKLYVTQAVPGNSLSPHNLKLLMRVYEKKSKEAEDRIKELEQKLQDSKDLAKRYHAMYQTERDKSGGKPQNTADKSSGEDKHKHDSSKTNSNSQASTNTRNQRNKSPTRDGGSGGGSPRCKSASPQRQSSTGGQQKAQGSRDSLGDGDLEDDEAVYKRHVVRIVDSGAMHMTTPIRVQDIIRKSEVLISENEALKREVERLKWDNKQLIKQTKGFRESHDQLLHEIGASEAARRDTAKRLEKEQKQNQILSRSLSRQAADWIQFRKEMQAADDNKRLARIGPMSSSQSSVDSRPQTSVKRNSHMARNIPVENWAQANKT